MCLSLCLCVYHAHYSAVLSLFGKPEVSLEPYLQGHAIFQISKNFMHMFTQFHAISHNFHAIWAISAIFWANFNMLGIRMHVLKLRNALVVFSHNLTHEFMQFLEIWAIQAIFW